MLSSYLSVQCWSLEVVVPGIWPESVQVGPAVWVWTLFMILIVVALLTFSSALLTLNHAGSPAFKRPVQPIPKWSTVPFLSNEQFQGEENVGIEFLMLRRYCDAIFLHGVSYFQPYMEISVSWCCRHINSTAWPLVSKPLILMYSSRFYTGLSKRKRSNPRRMGSCLFLYRLSLQSDNRVM